MTGREKERGFPEKRTMKNFMEIDLNKKKKKKKGKHEMRVTDRKRHNQRVGEFRENSKQTKSKASSMHHAAHSKIHKRKSIQEPNFFPLSQYFQFSYSISTNIMDVLLGRSSSSSKYECLLFDMDDTLYPLSSGLNLACRKNIEEFMLHQLHIDESEVPRMCLDLYREYGTTMAGLKALGYEFDNDEFHAFVHGRLPYDALKPDPLLRNLLLSMPQRKIIFTNADKAHATQVLSRMGLEDCFEGVICFETLNPPNTPLDCADAPEANPTILPHSTTSQILCKPSIEAIHAAIRIASVDPTKTIFFDDSARNIASGKAAGLHTVIVGSSVVVAGADHALRSIHNIKEALAEIWEGEAEEAKKVVLVEQVIQSTAVETAVLA